MNKEPSPNYDDEKFYADVASRVAHMVGRAHSRKEPIMLRTELLAMYIQISEMRLPTHRQKLIGDLVSVVERKISKLHRIV